ncbi:Cytochrome c oxidase subunit 5B, mitochondrial [Vermiconidia calcicola]|uniref:Cytochrome c oxidase subunit 5B, mitochondrial n=1 Tax=Vermiconidia calcicola TaxID=1690605 RepID=A0ACC3MZQ3_9PEZI|nr:Cytochrome c oxidase subunit 5B, mitochondrial [Vermiconidia calcicola]
MLRSPLLRQVGAASTRRTYAAALPPLSHRCQSTAQSGQQTRKAHAISNPTLANIEKRWEAMPPQEQADLWMQLRDRMKVDWNELTFSEKKAAYWIAFGPHGPRAETPPGEATKVFSYTLMGVAAATVIFLFTQHFSGGAPSTMTKEYQQKTNEYFQEKRIEPITGPGQEGYKGKGMIQSVPDQKGPS